MWILSTVSIMFQIIKSNQFPRYPVPSATAATDYSTNNFVTNSPPSEQIQYCGKSERRDLNNPETVPII